MSCNPLTPQGWCGLAPALQIAGGYPDAMTQAAQLIEDNVDVSFVDINSGCPIDIICQRGAGRSPGRALPWGGGAGALLRGGGQACSTVAGWAAGHLTDACAACATPASRGISGNAPPLPPRACRPRPCGATTGSAMMLKTTRTQQVLTGMSNVLSCPVTIKIRKGGWADELPHSGQPHIAAELLCRLEETPRSRCV
jgi:hypothetical protein